MNLIEIQKITVTGNETVNSEPINGKIRKIFIDYAADANANTDTTIAIVGPVANETVYTATDSKTDLWVYSHNYAEDTGGTDLTYDGTNEIAVPWYVSGVVACTIAQNTAAKVTTFYIYYER